MDVNAARKIVLILTVKPAASASVRFFPHNLYSGFFALSAAKRQN